MQLHKQQHQYHIISCEIILTQGNKGSVPFDLKQGNGIRIVTIGHQGTLALREWQFCAGKHWRQQNCVSVHTAVTGYRTEVAEVRLLQNHMMT